MEKKFDDNDEMQIDLLELAYALKKKLWLIILGLIVGAFGAGLYSKILLTPIYKSTAMVYVLSKETTLTSLADLQIGSQLTKDYSVLVTSRPVLEQVIEKQKLDMNVDQLKPKIIEEGVPAAYPSSPNVKKNAAMGGLAAAVLISGIICLGVIMDDTIKTEEDVEKYLGLTVLASIPDVDETGKSENEKGRKKKKTKGAV